METAMKKRVLVTKSDQDAHEVSVRYLAQLLRDKGMEVIFTRYSIIDEVAKAALEMSVRYLAEAVGPEGIRVNAISAGPLKTLAAAGVGGFNQIASIVADKAPLRRNITQDDVAGAAVYLTSELARGVTGEVHFVDSGYNIIGL